MSVDKITKESLLKHINTHYNLHLRLDNHQITTAQFNKLLEVTSNNNPSCIRCHPATTPTRLFGQFWAQLEKEAYIEDYNKVTQKTFKVLIKILPKRQEGFLTAIAAFLSYSNSFFEDPRLTLDTVA